MILTQVVVPWHLVTGDRRRSRLDPLTQLRLIFMALIIALGLNVVAFSYLGTWHADPEDWWIGALVVVVGLVAHVVAGPIVRPRMTRGGNDAELVSSFRDGMFIGLGIFESVALIGLALTFFAGLWTYALAIPISLLGFARITPSQRTFAHLDRLLAERGSPLRMTEAWRRALEAGPSARSE